MPHFPACVRSTCFLLSVFASTTVSGQVPGKWDTKAVEKEFVGMRRYAWATSDELARKLKDSDVKLYPGIHAFLGDFRDAQKSIDPKTPPAGWDVLDVEKLATRNPNFWAAVYEIRPADPLLMWFHSTLYAVDGQVDRTGYTMQLALQSPVESPLKHEIMRLLGSANQLVAVGNNAVRSGTALHDNEDFAGAVAVYRDVLETLPTHSGALYELGLTLRKLARAQGESSPEEVSTHFARARQLNPFLTSAYQGTMTADSFQQLNMLHTRAVPAWNKFAITAPGKCTAEQLVRLSHDLQAGRLHEFALIVRQLAIAHRDSQYEAVDRQFIQASLKALMPNEDFSKTLDGLQDRDFLKIGK